MLPAIGQLAPPFVLLQGNGEVLKLEDLQGQKVLLYFYPKDDTSGCTRQACDLTALQLRFQEQGTRIVGISKDSVERHQKFKERHDLSITLLSDPQGITCQAYGVWVEKSMYGRRYFGIERTTFLIDEKGIIQQIWRKVKVPNHAETLLHYLKTI